MYRLTYLLFFSLILCQNATADISWNTYFLKGAVEDENRQPVRHVEIILEQGKYSPVLFCSFSKQKVGNAIYWVAHFTSTSD